MYMLDALTHCIKFATGTYKRDLITDYGVSQAKYKVETVRNVILSIIDAPTASLSLL